MSITFAIIVYKGGEIKMKTILVTGGTTFVSRYVAEYYLKKDYKVYVLNRNTKPQSNGVILIEADRKNIGEKLRDYHFDIVFDITAYNEDDINSLLNALGSFNDYIMISSSAVYPEYLPQPFTEETQIGKNKIWGKYGTDKIAAEKTLLKRVPSAYILRPPYLYGPMNNVYREAFVFECALQDRKFFIPKNGELKLQFFHVEDLCRFMDILIKTMPTQHIFNVGNKCAVTVKEWVNICYNVAGKYAETIPVFDDVEQRNFFSFYDYEYFLDVNKQYELMPETKPLIEGLQESFEWYICNKEKVIKKPFIEFIDNNLI
jgi:nucleoside-diphosphate-sugar epimerase